MSALNRRGASLLMPAGVFFGCVALATRPAAMGGALAVMAAVGTLGLVGPTGAANPIAAVHIPAQGVRVLPLDLAAGVLLGWQRWATGGWPAPAVTHIVANLLQVR